MTGSQEAEEDEEEDVIVQEIFDQIPNFHIKDFLNLYAEKILHYNTEFLQCSQEKQEHE